MTDSPLSVFDRHAALRLLSEQLDVAWDSFDRPRPADPELTRQLRERLASPLPDDPGDAAAALDDAAHVLDASVSPARPLYAAYIGSTGLEAGVLGGRARQPPTTSTSHPPPAPPRCSRTRRCAGWRNSSAIRSTRDGAFTSGGMTSNLTALTGRARARAAGRPRDRRLRAARAAVYCSEEVAPLGRARGRGRSGSAARLCVGSRPTSAAACGSTRSQRRARARPRAPASTRSRWSQPPAPRLPARSIRLPRSPTSARSTESGCMSTAPTAVRRPALPPRAAVRRHRRCRLAHDRRPQVDRCAEELQPGDAAPPGAARAARSRTTSATCCMPASPPTASTARSSTRARSVRSSSGSRSGSTAPPRYAAGSSARSSTPAPCTALARAPGFELLNDPILSTSAFAIFGRRRTSTRTTSDSPRDSRRRPRLPRPRGGRRQTCLRVCFMNFRTGRDDVLAIPDVIDEVAAAIT